MIYQDKISSIHQRVFEISVWLRLEMMSLSTCQTHPNRWTLMSTFKKFCRMVGLEPIANVFTLTGKPNFAKN